MPFSNPVVAGGILQVPAIESLNYVQGVSGWIVDRNGNAEFNNLSIRGQFNGTDFVINAAGIFFYSSAPALNDLVISLAWTAGMDIYGNPYPSGLQVLNHGGADASGIAIGFSGSTPLQYFLNGDTNLTNDPAEFVNVNGSGTAMFATLVITSGEDATQTDYIAINLDSSNESGTHFPTVSVIYIDPSAAGHNLFSVDLAGATVIGTITAVEPGTGLSRTNVAVAETWHAVTPASGWALGTSPAMSVKLGPDGTARLEGTIKYSSGTPGSGSTMFTLPAAYRPVTGKFYLTPTANGIFLISIATSGAVTISNWATYTLGATPSVYISYTYPLDI